MSVWWRFTCQSGIRDSRDPDDEGDFCGRVEVGPLPPAALFPQMEAMVTGEHHQSVSLQAQGGQMSKDLAHKIIHVADRSPIAQSEKQIMSFASTQTCLDCAEVSSYLILFVSSGGKVKFLGEPENFNASRLLRGRYHRSIAGFGRGR